MRKKFHMTVFLLFAGTFLFAGNLLKNGDFSQGGKFWSVNFAAEPVKDGLLFEIPELEDGRKRLMIQTLELKDQKWYRLSFRLRCGKKGLFRTVYQQRNAPYSNLGLERNFSVEPGVNRLAVCFQARHEADKNGHLLFNLSRLPGKTLLSDVRLEELDGFQNLTASGLNREWTVSVSGSSKTVRMTDNGIDLKALFPEKFHPNRSKALLVNRFRTKYRGFLRMSVSGDWFFGVSLNGKHVYSGSNADRFSPAANLNLEVEPGENTLEITVRAGAKGWNCRLEEPWTPIVFRENDEWKPYRFELSDVIPGSALDLSAQVERPAGKLGRLTISKRGELVFEKAPDRPVRLLGTNGIDIFPGTGKNISPEEFRRDARRFAQSARRQGYRIVRTHGYLDKLCENTGADRRMDHAALDRWDILIDELKKEGIYLHLTLLSFSLYSNDYQETKRHRRFHKLMMYLDGGWEYDTLRFAAETLFRHVNPYTGVAWKDEPAIAFVEYYNEQSLGLNVLSRTVKEYPEARGRMKAMFAGWQKERYGDAACELPVGLKGKFAEREALFWLERAQISAKRCGEIVRKAGYTGLVVPYSFSKMLGHGVARWLYAQVGDCHAYYSHPSNWSRAGSVVGSKSAIGEGADYWRSSFGTKLTGRPFIVSEYNHCFWNPFRYELGVLFGAYSALQGGGALMIHSDAVRGNTAKYGRLSCFEVGRSPLMRAGQFLTAQLFQRGDVRTSPHSVVTVIPHEFLRKGGNALHALDHTQTLLALITGFGVEYPDFPSAPATVPQTGCLRLAPAGVSHIFSSGWYSSVIADRNDSFPLQKTIDRMKEEGILTADNRSNAERRIFESDTKELLMNSREKSLLVTTPRTEAAAVPDGQTVSLKTVRFLRSSVSGCVALTSIDGDRPLSASRRFVLLWQTEEVNSGMRLGADRETLHFLGTRPLLCRTGELELKAGLLPANWKLYALGTDGTRREEIPVAYAGGELLIKFHSGKLKQGPTTFFELIAE